MPRIAFAVTVVAVLAGCAAPVSQQAIVVPAGVVPGEKLLSQVYVGSVSGGNDVSPHLAAQIDNDEFKAALEQALAARGYETTSSNARFKVDAQQLLAPPGFGLNFTVKSTVRYTITEAGSTRSMPITVTGTARTADTLYAREQVKIARARAIADNINAFIKQLTEQFGK